jgi:hypothetical protein
LVAVGRQLALDELNLEAAGVQYTKEGITTNKTLCTNVPHIWAAGDIASKYQFTHVASDQGELAAQNVFARKPKAFDDRVIPWVTLLPKLFSCYGLDTTMTVPVLSPSGSWLATALYVYDDFVALVTVNVMLVLLVLRLFETLQ